MNEFTTGAISQFFLDHQPGVFRPCAYYDDHLDCIRVQIKDCSFTEIRLNKVFTIYKDNHADDSEFMGFTVKGVRWIFEKAGLPEPKKGPVILAQIIDAAIKADPEAFSDLIQREFSDRFDMEVEDFQYLKAA